MELALLTLEEVLGIHEDRIREYGGLSGRARSGCTPISNRHGDRDVPRSFLHETIFEMAAAYLYHICRNHPCVDGNKRTGLACALAFLRLNGVRIRAEESELVDLVLGVAEGKVSKAEVAVFLQAHQQ